MPLTPVYKWTENENSIQITIDNVAIKDQSQLFCSDRVVKLNAPPYLLLLDLKSAVDDDRSTATVIHNRRVVFQLSKAAPGLWGTLTAQGDKQLIKQQREESVTRAHEKQVAAQQERLARKQKEEKAAIEHQIAQERAQRARIEALKQQELQQERQQLQQWQHQQQSQQQQLLQLEAGDESDYEDDLQDDSSTTDATAASAASASAQSSPAGVSQDHPDYHDRGWRPSIPAAAAAASQQDEQQDNGPAGGSSNSDSSRRSIKEANAEQITLTAPCSTAQQAPAMQRLVSEAAAAAAAGSSSSLLAHDSWGAPDASQPAAAAASGGDEQLLTIAATKSAAKPPAAAAAAASTKPRAPVRCRAEPVTVNFTKLETPHLPARELREVEFKSIKSHRDKSDSVDVADRQPAFLKDKGDGLAAQGNFRGAINAYSRALELDPTQAALWSNRAACHLALGQAAECVQDCTAAADLLQAMQQRLLEADGAPAAERELLAGLLPQAAAAVTYADADRATGGSVHIAGAAVSSIVSKVNPEAADANTEEQGQAAVAAAGSAVARLCGADTANAHSTVATRLEYEQQQQEEQQQQQENRTLTNNETEKTTAAPVASSSTSNGVLEAAASSAAAGAKVGGAAASSAAVHKMTQQLVKVLARRAAARVEMQQLQEAADDLQQALRYDPDNPQLKADALEVAAALHPSSSTYTDSLKQRGDARFKAGDIPGAAEAYSALIQVLEWQQLQQVATGAAKCEEQQQNRAVVGDSRGCAPQHARLLAAYSNRAACWLSVEKYQQCVDDCNAALLLALGNSDAAVTAVTTAPIAAAAAAAVAAATQVQGSCIAEAGEQLQTQQSLLQLLQQCAPGRLLQQEGAALVRSVARLLARAAVAHGCLKQLQPAVELYSWAQQYWLAVGDEQRASELATDQSRLQQLAGDDLAAAASNNENGKYV